MDTLSSALLFHPCRIVDHFLHEYRQYGTYRGVCSVAFRWQDMENEHLRMHFKVC